MQRSFVVRIISPSLGIALLACTVSGCTMLSATRDITSVLHKQAACWNRGDIDGFMEHYVKSDALTFSSGGKTTRGWRATLDRYKKRYPDKATMGRLTFSGLEISQLSCDAALVLGRWNLEREMGDVGGNFSLIFKRIERRWVILHDHTSVLQEN